MVVPIAQNCPVKLIEIRRLGALWKVLEGGREERDAYLVDVLRREHLHTPGVQFGV